ncbi:MAG: hypothetical protein ACLFRZ_06970 [Rhodosalinus sp.]|uniref:hypothetical protein n=1 Tax=Rhodosalinus sp. TaxID=2047741 RepID=UPI00397BB37E
MPDRVFSRIAYEDLNPRQQENRNFHKLAARLADYGFNCLRLSDDWQGADLIACHVDGHTFLKVQLKGRLVVDRKYVGKDVHVAFFDHDDGFVYPHDAFLTELVGRGSMNEDRRLWREKGIRSWPRMPGWAREWLEPWRI